MATSFIDLTGEKELFRLLDVMEKGARNKIARPGVVVSSKMILKQIKKLIPNLRSHRLEKRRQAIALRKLLKMRANKTKRRSVVARFMRLPPRRELHSAGVFPNLDEKWYFPAIWEFKGRSYIRAGFDQVRNNAFRVMKTAMGKKIDEIDRTTKR
jgi:DNA-directed RNA polymerase